MVFGINVAATDFTTFQNFAKQVGAAQTQVPGGLPPSSTDSFGTTPPPVAPTGGAKAIAVGRGVWLAVGVVVAGVLGWGM